MQIFIAGASGPATAYTVEADATVESVKAMIENKEFVPAHLIRLVNGAESLEGGSLLGNGVEDEDTLTMLLDVNGVVPRTHLTCIRLKSMFASIGRCLTFSGTSSAGAILRNRAAPTVTCRGVSAASIQRKMMTSQGASLPSSPSLQGVALYSAAFSRNINATKLLQRTRYFSSGGGKKLAKNAQSTTKQAETTFLQRWMAPKEMPPRWTLRWYGEMVLICTVFAITGSSTMILVRPAVSDVLGLKGTFKDGPWSYRICSIVIMTPLYASLLVIVGTIFGRHSYFRFFAVKMFSRFGIPPELMDETFHQTKKTFRKY